MTAVELRGVGKVFPDGHVALDGMDLRVDEGEFVVLLGPSGCGKTTALRIVAGLEAASAGEVLFGGERADRRPVSERDLGMLFQSSALYPHLDVRANIGFPLALAGEPHRRIGHRVDAVARRLGIDDLLDRRPGRLSGGQRQRVAMARALVRSPATLLMDEPMSDLDAKLRTELRSSLALLHAELGTTVIYVTHDQGEAMALADRIVVMRDGHVVQVGTPAELYERPVDLFVATFLGVPPMNVVEAGLLDDRHLRVGGVAIDVGSIAARWPDLDRRSGGRVALGVRPDAVSIDRSGPVTGEVVEVESTGPDRFAAMRVPAHGVVWTGAGPEVVPGPATLVVAVGGGGGGGAGRPIEPDLYRPVSASIDPDRMHLFDLATGFRIGSGAGRGA